MKIEELEQLFPGSILPYGYPKPYPSKINYPSAIKGIVLGCDPSNISKTDGSTIAFETVFGIEGKGKDKRYFYQILKNLELLDLSLGNIYVQNLCRNYFKDETSKNKIWRKAAEKWRDVLKKELDDLQIPNSVPVFLTSNLLYLALLKEGKKKYKPQEFYSNPELIPISENYLERPLIPLYRGGFGTYDLTNWPEYTRKIKSILKDII